VVCGTTRPGDEEGFSLVETLVALAVLVIVLPAMFGVIYTEVASARIQRQNAVNNQVMVSVAEAVESDAYLSGATTGTCGTSYSTSTAILPASWSGSMTQCYSVVATQTASPVTSLQSLQLVTITVYYAANDKGSRTSVVVVKSNPS
jgi:type II secretory pathway pseudopilin PulG